MNIAALHNLRQAELESAIALLPSRGRLLEIGAGTGWQAKMLAHRGFDVTAIDLADSNYRGDRMWSIVDYDGEHIPGSDRSFDVIFSSNTLEHIPKIQSFLKETRRVLADDGVCLHVLPTPTWRFSSAVGHYLRVDRVAEELSVLLGKRASTTKQDYHNRGAVKGGLLRWIVKRALPPVHGATGNIVTEHYYFSETCWKKRFVEAGFRVEAVARNELYYTGHHFLGTRASVNVRRMVSRICGSACKMYMLRKTG